MKQIVIVLTNIYHHRLEYDLRNHELVLLAISLRKHHHVAILICDPYNQPHEADLKFLESFGLSIVELKSTFPCSNSWLKKSYEVFETLRSVPSDVIISEEYYGLLAFYASFTDEHSPIITYALGGSYEDKMQNSAPFANVNDLLHAVLEDLQLRKSAKIIASRVETKVLYISLGIDAACFAEEIEYVEIPKLQLYEEMISISSRDHWLKQVENFKQNADSLSLDPEQQIEVSIVIATMDREKFLPFALESCIHQSVKPSEIIIVDDGSLRSEAIQDIVDLYSTELVIRLVRNDVSVGQAKSRNLGAKLARFDVIAFLDDDNYFLENHLEENLKVLRDPNVVASSTFMNLVYSDDPISRSSKPEYTAVFCGEHFGSLNKIYNLVCDTHILIRKAFFDQIGGFPDLYRSSQEDWGLGLKILSNEGRFKCTGVPTILYRVNNNGVWANGSGVRKWWPIHNTSAQVKAPEWWYDELSRVALSVESQIAGSKKTKYIRYAISLVKRRDIKTLSHGIMRWILKRNL